MYRKYIKRMLDLVLSLMALIILMPLMIVIYILVRIKLGKPRLTKFGKMLRSTSLDELLELFNIIKGDMSIVGPRPLLVKYLPYYTEEERHRHDVRPGLTGLAQVSGRNLMRWEEKLEKDIEYVNTYSFYNDINIILKTIKKVLKREDIVSSEAVNVKGYILRPLDIERKEEHGKANV